MHPLLPWRSHDALVHLTADWQRRLAGLAVVRVAAGPGWLGLSLASEPRTHLVFTMRPGAVLLWDAPEFLPTAHIQAMGQTRRHPLASLLGGNRLLGAGVLPADRVVVLAFTNREIPPFTGTTSPAVTVTEGTAAKASSSSERYLLHQLFGPRGNLVLLDHQARILWAHHRPPHCLLAATPPPDIFTPANETTSARESVATPETAASFHIQALTHLTQNLQTAWYQRVATALRRADGSSRRLVANLTRDLENAARGAEYRRIAETLAAHLSQIPRGAEKVVLPSPHDGEQVEMDLDPALTATANLKNYFRLARKAERGRAVIAARLAQARIQAADLACQSQELTDITAVPADHLAALIDWIGRHGQRIGTPLPTTGRTNRAAADQTLTSSEPERPFRRYRIDDQWEVWVGRNQRENDELTHRRSAPEDLWFHAQGVTGSHVVLRTQGKPAQVPARVIAKTGALAALHSKARHSSLVPVIYTRRKYVRKPRKTPAGTASYIQEKSVMVTPGVMAGVKLI